MPPPERVAASKGPRLAPPISDTVDTAIVWSAVRLTTRASWMAASDPVGSSGTPSHRHSPLKNASSMSSPQTASVPRATTRVNTQADAPLSRPITTP